MIAFLSNIYYELFWQICFTFSFHSERLSSEILAELKSRVLSEDTHSFILYIRDRIEQGKPVFRGRTGSGTVHAGTKDQTGTGVYTIMYKKRSIRRKL